MPWRWLHHGGAAPAWPAGASGRLGPAAAPPHVPWQGTHVHASVSKQSADSVLPTCLFLIKQQCAACQMGLARHQVQHSPAAAGLHQWNQSGADFKFARSARSCPGWLVAHRDTEWASSLMSRLQTVAKTSWVVPSSMSIHRHTSMPEPSRLTRSQYCKIAVILVWFYMLLR